MNPNARQILTKIEEYLNEYPNHRFTQALFNLKILEFGGSKPDGSSYLLRDCYYDGDSEVLKRMEGEFKPLKKADHILIVMSPESNEEAKFLFSKPQITLKELEEYNWLQRAQVKDETTVALINKIVNRKLVALKHQDYEWAGSDVQLELEIISKAALLNGFEKFKIEAQKDFDTVRCYLLLQIMEKNDLHEGFEKKV